MKKIKQALAFEQLEAEMELISISERHEVIGGMSLAQLKNIVNVMTQNGVTHLTSNDLEIQGTSFEALANYTSSSSFSLKIGGTVVNFAPQLTTTVPSNFRSLTNHEVEMALNQDDPRWKISIGQMTGAGISQQMDLDVSGAGYFSPGSGVLAYGASFKGDVGFSIDQNGKWVASGVFNVTPPVSFTNVTVNGNIDIYINGSLYTSFSMVERLYPGGSYNIPGVTTISGKATLPSWFNGTQTVEFRASAGVNSYQGTNTTGHVSASKRGSLTLPGVGAAE